MISVGANDGSGNPDPATEARLRANGVTIYETKDYGTVVITAMRMAYTVGNQATPVGQIVTPTITLTPTQVVTQPTFTLGKLYPVGDPGSYLAYASAGALKIVTPRAVVTQVAISKPGVPEFGKIPPTQPYVRWYPSARWGTGNP